MELIREKVLVQQLEKMAEKSSRGLVKAVVDVEQEIMVVDADLHADQENLLLEQHDSSQTNLWGINIYPARVGEIGWIEFDSMINLRPSWGNKSRGVDDPRLQEKIRTIVKKLVTQ